MRFTTIRELNSQILKLNNGNKKTKFLYDCMIKLS